MTLHARWPGLGWDELLALLIATGAEGTLRVESELGSVALLFTNGVVLLPLPATCGSREEDQRRGNRRLLRCLRARQVAFRFEPGEPPPGTVARRTLVLRLEPLLREALTRRARGVGSGEPTPAVWGTIPGRWVPALLRELGRRRRSGRLVLRDESDDQRPVEVRLVAGELRRVSSDEPVPPAELLGVSSAATVQVALLASGEAATAHDLPAATAQLLVTLQRLQDLERRTGKLLAARETGFRLRAEAADQARRVSGLPELLPLLDGRHPFADMVRLARVPALVAGRALARLLLERLVVPTALTPSAIAAQDEAQEPVWSGPRISDSRRLTPIRPASSRVRALRAG